MTFSYRQLSAALQSELRTQPYDRWLSVDGDEVASFSRDGANFIVRFPDTADFAIDMANRAVIATPAPGVDEGIVDDLHFNQILPLTMGHDGDLVYHASAVNIEGSVAAFIGRSGTGKSTLATSFALSGQPFLTDDGLILDEVDRGYLVRARSPQLRLCRDSASALLDIDGPRDNLKTKVGAVGSIFHCATSVPLGAMFCLDHRQSSDIRITRLPPPLAASILMQHSFLLDVEDRGRMIRHFERVIALAQRIPCFQLDFPREYPLLSEVRRQVIGMFVREKETQ